MVRAKKEAKPKDLLLKGVTNKVKKSNVSLSGSILKALSASIPDELVGREVELESINQFLDSTVKLRKPGCLYISGAPGTGKTACLKKLVRSLPKSAKVVWVNCMLAKTGPDVFKHIWKQISVDGGTMSCAQAKHKLDQIMCNSKNAHVVVLDEIDYLEMKHQDVLYSLMEWPARKESRVVLIGVANSLDLTDRLLPRLHTFPGLQPQLLHFPPYTRQQLGAIIASRMALISNSECVISAPAITLLAAKISAIAGDARKALAVCSRSIEVAAKMAPGGESDAQSPKTPPVGPALIASVLSEVYEHPVTRGLAPSNPTTPSSATSAPAAAAALDTMPIHQKLVLCAQLICSGEQRTRWRPASSTACWPCWRRRASSARRRPRPSCRRASHCCWTSTRSSRPCWTTRYWRSL